MSTVFVIITMELVLKLVLICHDIISIWRIRVLYEQ